MTRHRWDNAQMMIALLLSLGFSLNALAKEEPYECYELLSFPAERPEPNALYAETAGHWMFERMTNSEPAGFAEFLADNGKNILTIKEKDRQRWIGYFALNEWRRLNAINDRQREAALSVELMKLRPAGDRSVQSFSARAQLDAQSATNLSRLLKRLDELYPRPAQVDQKRLDRVAALENADLNFLHKAPSELTLSRNPPILSPRELARLTLREVSEMNSAADDYYAKFVGESKSPDNPQAVGESQTIGFSLAATEKGRGAYNLGATVPGDAVRLKDEFADKGFLIPEFSSVNQLFAVLKAWAPEYMEKQIRHMRFSLPDDVRTQTEFDKYMDPGRAKTYFPDDRLYEKTPLLREAVGQLILTRQDAETFLRTAFRRFLETVVADENDFGNLVRETTKPGGTQRVWNAQFADFLKWPGIALRVPAAVPPTAYTIIRKEPLPNQKSFDDFASSQKPWDSRRLDHNSKP